MLRREDGHVLRRALDFEVEGRNEVKKTWKTQIGEESEKDALVMEDVGINRNDTRWR